MDLTSSFHALTEFEIEPLPNGDRPIYWYEGICPATGTPVRLPRTRQAEAIARCLMAHLTGDRYTREGKMYGILLVETPTGDLQVLKAFSGLLNGESTVAGWVPPLPGREQVAEDEARTLATLDEIRQRLLTLHQRPEPQQYADLMAGYNTKLQNLTQQHQQRKQARQQQRQTILETLAEPEQAIALEALDEQSRQDGIERRQLKRERDEAGRSLRETVEAIQAEIQYIKHQRKQVSRQLQAQIHAAYQVLNFAGMAQSLPQLIPQGIPSGTGDCCAPKLLHSAAQNRLRPLAMAEFWWGTSEGDRMAGDFYGACAERCQPMMGFLLSGLVEIEILYQDDDVIAVNKPAGLLSVPGRTGDRADSVVTRLQHQTRIDSLIPVHRLDQDTSGILLLATNPDAYRHLQAQFQTRHVRKVYEALLTGIITSDHGTIDLPLWGKPGDRPRQCVDHDHGKPSVTLYQVLKRMPDQTRIEFAPLTGRTHQLRVHAADPQGLGTPIVGDRLYGNGTSTSRLHLHARELEVCHPLTETALRLYAKTPF